MYGWMALWRKNQGAGGWLFDLEVVNNSVKAVDMAISGAQGVFAGTLQVTLEHQPK